MTMTLLQRPVAAGPERPAQNLFPEARARRRRLRITAAIFAAIVIVGSVVGFEHSLLFPSSTPQVTASGQLLPAPGHITSLIWTESFPLGTQWPTSGVEVATTLSRSARSIDTETFSYVTDPAKRIPVLQAVTRGTDAYLAVPAPSTPSAGHRVCWDEGPAPAGWQNVDFSLGAPLSPQPTTCRTVTKSWIEIPDVSSANASLLELPVLEAPAPTLEPYGTPVSVNPSTLLAMLRSQLDPSELFGELRRTASSLTRAGAATIDGVPTTEYKGVVEPGVGTRVAPSEVSSLYYSGLGADDNYNRLLEGIETFTVWVDHEGVVRRVLVDHWSFAFPDTEFTFTDFNRPIPKLPVHPGEVFLLPRGAWNVTIGSVPY